MTVLLGLFGLLAVVVISLCVGFWLGLEYDEEGKCLGK